MSERYDDILHLPHHTSATRSRMPIVNRAAQFAPFAALTGYDAAVRETARLTDRQIELEENILDVLDRKLQILAGHISQRPEISITYFEPDTKKGGGAYVTLVGTLKKIDDYTGTMILSSGERIALDRILDMDCDLFSE